MVTRTSDLWNILRFFEKPTHPSFTPKGVNNDIFFEIPQSYYPPNYEDLSIQMTSHIGTVNEGVIVEMDALPFELDLTKVKRLGRREHFSVFNPLHVACSSELINILMRIESKYLISACSKIQLADVNPYLFEYALSVVLLHRDDTRGLRIPSQVTYMPEFYVANNVLTEVARETVILHSVPNDGRKLVEITATSSELDPESQLAYFREDVGIALHHWHWHLVYPFRIDGEYGMNLVDKDRRGELFYYMHQQMLARYNTERLCNKLNRIRSFNYLREPIPEAYYPKLGAPFTKNMWAARPANTVLKDLNRETVDTTVLEVEIWRDRILDAIHSGKLNKGDGTIPLDEKTGIDILGNVIEASMLSPNKSYYGNLHNSGHLLIAYSHDPDNRYLENVGVMGDTRTAVRDPIFYRWHMFIDEIFHEHKKRLTPYTEKELAFKDVRIVEFKLITKSDSQLKMEKRTNEFITFMQVDKINLAHGLTVAQDGPGYLNMSHLQHEEFSYKITIENKGMWKQGTVRIFLAPSFNETGKPFLLNEQRRLFIELDKFVIPLQAYNTSGIIRSSKDSPITIPFQQMFADIDDAVNSSNDTSSTSNSFCGCGWPEHMLIPRGNVQGFKCHLFVMVTDYQDDKVELSSPDTQTSSSCQHCMKSAPSYCGLQNEKYPDKRAMGFPFDRPFASEFFIDDFIKSNMKVANVKITHLNNVVKENTANASKGKTQ